jgi:hypothetical protein
MIYSSLAVLVLSAASIMPHTNVVHLHPRSAQTDNRISLTLVNNGVHFHDVKIGTATYTIQPHHTLSVKAPEGTVVYASTTSFNHKRGDAILEVSPKLGNQKIDIN